MKSKLSFIYLPTWTKIQNRETQVSFLSIRSLFILYDKAIISFLLIHYNEEGNHKLSSYFSMYKKIFKPNVKNFELFKSIFENLLLLT